MKSRRRISPVLIGEGKFGNTSMATATIGTTRSTSARRKALRACAEALRVAVDYRLPNLLQRKLRKALDEKERASPTEHREFLVLVEPAQERSLQKVKAQVALQQLLQAFPELEG